MSEPKRILYEKCEHCAEMHKLGRPCLCAPLNVLPTGATAGQLEYLVRKAQAFDVLMRRGWTVSPFGDEYCVGNRDGTTWHNATNPIDAVLQADEKP